METKDKELASPEGYKIRINTLEHSEYYFADDAEPISRELSKARIRRVHAIVKGFNKDERELLINKSEYKDLQAASLVGIGHKGKNIAETKLAFKDAVIARQALQDRRDNLLEQINNATTIEELELITW